MSEDWAGFEDAEQSDQRRRAELIARLQARLALSQPKLSEEQVAAVVSRMADLVLRGLRKAQP